MPLLLSQNGADASAPTAAVDAAPPRVLTDRVVIHRPADRPSPTTTVPPAPPVTIAATPVHVVVPTTTTVPPTTTTVPVTTTRRRSSPNWKPEPTSRPEAT